MDPVLYYWQPSGIKGICDMLDGPNGGAVLADVDGLGKTAQTGGVLQHVSIVPPSLWTLG